MIRSRTAWRCVALGNIADTAIGFHLMSYSYGEKDLKKNVNLKELRNFILCVICVWSWFFSVLVYISLQFLPIFLLKLAFRFSVF